MKRLMTSLLLGSWVVLIAQLQPAAAQQPPTPVRPPSLFNEGTGGRLTPDQIRELLPWSYDSKIELKELLARLPQLSPRQQHEALETELRRIVARTEGSRAALLMRYVINRGLLFSNEIAVESGGAGPLSLDQQIRVLRASAELAVKYADSDAQFLKEGKVLPTYGAFGIDYAQYLMKLSQSILDASAQYRVIRLALGLLVWDLYQDERRLEYAPVIVKLQQVLDQNPEKAPSDLKDDAVLARARALRAGYERAMSALGVILDPSEFEPGQRNSWAVESIRPEAVIQIVDTVSPDHHAALGVYSDSLGTGPYIDLFFDVDRTYASGAVYLPIRVRVGFGMSTDEEGRTSVSPSYVDMSVSAARFFSGKPHKGLWGSLGFLELGNARLRSYQAVGLDRVLGVSPVGIGLQVQRQSEDVVLFLRGIGKILSHSAPELDESVFPESRQLGGDPSSSLAFDLEAGLVARMPRNMALRIDLSGSRSQVKFRGVEPFSSFSVADLIASVGLDLRRRLALVAEGGWQQARQSVSPGDAEYRWYGRSSKSLRVSLRYWF